MCDVRCCRQGIPDPRPPYLSDPCRMRGPDWTGVAFDENTDPEAVFRMFDKAMSLTSDDGFTIVLENSASTGPRTYQETLIQFDGGSKMDSTVPERIRQMKSLYDPGDFSFQQRCRNFCVQGRFMEDYVDDAPWDGEINRYFVTYHDLRVDQLRGYFTWRTAVRAGRYEETNASFAYIYLYELLNGIGAPTPEDTLRKMEEFESGYLDSGKGDQGMRRNLRRWMLEFSVLNDMGEETARRCLDPELAEADRMVSVLRDPGGHADEEVFDALCRLAGDRYRKSPALKADPETSSRIFAEAWRSAGGEPFLQSLFGRREACPWHPLNNAVYCYGEEPSPKRHVVDDCREYEYRDGIWTEKSYRPALFDKKTVSGFMHEADRRLRTHLGIRPELKAVTEEQRFAPFIIKAIGKVSEEARKPKVVIDFSGLEKIRKDAGETCESLLVEEGPEEPESGVLVKEAEEEVGATVGIPLSDSQARILMMVLEGKPVRQAIESEHGMAEIYADAINEALFDEIGDNAVECDGQDIVLVEDYREEVVRIMRGKA